MLVPTPGFRSRFQAFTRFSLLLLTALPCLPQPLNVTATTSLVADLVRSVGGDQIQLSQLMGPGIDPHLYKPRASDVARVQRADVLFFTGLHLEGKLEDLLGRLRQSGRSVYAFSDAIPPDRLIWLDSKQRIADPHFWMDASLWALVPPWIAEKLGELRPEHKADFEQRARDLQSRLIHLHAWAQNQVDQLPRNRRVLITSHDAFNYFGRAYDFDVIALQGVSTVTEAGLADFTRLVDLIRSRNVPAIFVETSVSPTTIRRISRDSGAQVGGELFSDALGGSDETRNGHKVGSYEGMFRHNLDTLINALK